MAEVPAQTQPRTLIFWGQRDIFFTPEGGEAYLRDLPKAEIHRLDRDTSPSKIHSTRSPRTSVASTTTRSPRESPHAGRHRSDAHDREVAAGVVRNGTRRVGSRTPRGDGTCTWRSSGDTQ